MRIEAAAVLDLDEHLHDAATCATSHGAEAIEYGLRSGEPLKPSITAWPAANAKSKRRADRDEDAHARSGVE